MRYYKVSIMTKISTVDPVNKSYRVAAGLFSGAAAMTFPIVGAICNLLREYNLKKIF